MATFDISDPARPAPLATIAPGTWGNEVVIEPGRKLLSYTGQERFALVDVSDPRQPAVLPNTPVAAGKGTMGSAFSPDGKYLVVCQRGIFSMYDVQDARVWRIGRTPADLTKLQTLPCYFYNSKFWVEGDRVFTNSEGIDELLFVDTLPRERAADWP